LAHCADSMQCHAELAMSNISTHEKARKGMCESHSHSVEVSAAQPAADLGPTARSEGKALPLVGNLLDNIEAHHTPLGYDEKTPRRC
jgi:proline dehydrogenase